MDGIEVVRGPPNEIKNVFKSEESDKDSVDNFQKFVYELFEKNGILNDLRAYLRRHIVDVLRSSHAGDPPMCQKIFSQRLELKSQALNILVAEYLLRAKFNYTLSVFVSELPLPNMVFDFASNLMKGAEGDILHFKDKDVWSIINYLGMKCDTSFVTHILEMYKNEGKPLLSCLIQSFPLSSTDFPREELHTSSDEVVFSDHSSDSLSEKTSKKFSKFSTKCQHYAICKGCHSRLLRLREKYKKKKDTEHAREPSLTSLNLKSVMKNLDAVEGNIVNEMFEQLKGVFEAEVDLIRAEHERREQQRLHHQQHSIRQQQQQMEEAFKAREEELERGVRAKKKFLWGLARSLRAQHDHLARAMAGVKYHTQRLKKKEEDLKTQLAEVEKLMKTRGADLQTQISSELVALEGQLDSVKRERQAVNREKTELEQLRQQISTNHASVDVEEIEAVSDKAWSNYDLLKTELSVLRKYIESSRDEPKCVVERSTVTDVNAQSVNDRELFNTEQVIRNPELLNNDTTVKTPDIFSNELIVSPDIFKNQSTVTNPEMFNNEHVIRDTELLNREQFVRNPQLLNNEQNARNLQQLNNEHIVRNLPLLNNEQTVKNPPLVNNEHIFRDTDLFNNEQFIKNPQLLNNEQIVRNLQLLNNEQVIRNPQLMNNEQNKTVREDDHRFKNNQLINDFKKLKNVNFCVGNAEEMSVERSASQDAHALLKQENERLREYARQQEQRVNALQAAISTAEERPRTVPAPPPPPRRPRARYCVTNEVPMTCKLGWRCKGAGEETTLFTCAPPRVFVPGETVPFIGLLHDRHDSRRLMNQWRAARRSSPLRVPRPAPPRHMRTPPLGPSTVAHGQGFTYPNPGFQIQNEAQPNQQAEILILDPDLSILGSEQTPGVRANSPKSVLKEAKEKLRTKPAKYVESPPTTSARDKSPATVLREAKLRLKKLEIEAEAVEQSYLDYRKRQTELRSEREHSVPAREEAQVTKDVDDMSTKAPSTFQRSHQRHRPPSPVKSDVHTYLQEYSQKLNLSETQFSNRNSTANKVKPIPIAYSSSRTENAEKNGQANNYLDTPLEEFQRYYKTNDETRVKTPEPGVDRPSPQPRPPPESPPADQPPNVDTLDSAIKQLEARKDALIKVKNSKKFELEILKQNITKIYYVLDNDIKNNKKNKGDEVLQDVENDDGSHTPSVTKDKDNVLSIEVDTGDGRSEMKIEAEPKELLVVVQSEMAAKPEREALRGDITVLISPKRSSTDGSSPKMAPHCKRSVSPEQAAKLTRNDVLEAIYHADLVKVNSNEEVTEDVSKGNPEETANATDDDFSADVDNYDISRTHSSWDNSEYCAKLNSGHL